MANHEHVEELDDHDPTVHHEETDINVRSALIFTAIFVASAFVLHFVVWYTFSAFAKAERKKDKGAMSEVRGIPSHRIPPGARLQPFPEPVERRGENVPSGVGSELAPVPMKDPKQSTPAYDMKQLSNRYEQKLNSYGWVDKRTGVVHIPIAEAKKAVLKKGFAVRQLAPQPAVASQPATAATTKTPSQPQPGAAVTSEGARAMPQPPGGAAHP